MHTVRQTSDSKDEKGRYVCTRDSSAPPDMAVLPSSSDLPPTTSQPCRRDEMTGRSKNISSTATTESKVADDERSAAGAGEGKMKSASAREAKVPSIQLPHGTRMPLVGMGFWQVPNNITAQLVYDAIKHTGVRHLDLASVYGNEKEVGEGLKRIISEGIVSRSELFITSKLWNTYHRHVEEAIERTLDDLQLTYVDLYLIHFPMPLKFIPFNEQYPPNGWESASGKGIELDEDLSIRDTWMKMESLIDTCKTREIGISNFPVALIRELLSFAKYKPCVLQVELHPYLSQEPLIRFCKEHDIHVFAYSPLGNGSYVQNGTVDEGETNALKDRVVKDVAKSTGMSPQQVLLRWGLQRGTGVIFRSSQLKHIEDNLDVANDDFLSEDQMKQLNGMNRNLRFNDPKIFGEKLFGTWISLFD